MAIYTRTGDRGTTAIFGGKRLSKSDPQIAAYGTIDELTSFIGLVIVKIKKGPETALLTKIQRSLYEVMAVLSGAKKDLNYLEEEVKMFEKTIDKLSLRLPELHRFILPQGGEIAVLYHIARSAARRAEREVVSFFEKSKVKNSKVILVYLNRVSDLFFVLARKNTRGREILT